MKMIFLTTFQFRPVENLDWVIFVLFFTLLLAAIVRAWLFHSFDFKGGMTQFRGINENQGLFSILTQLSFAMLFGTISVYYLTHDYDYVLYHPLIKVLAVAAFILAFFFLRNLLEKAGEYAFGMPSDQNIKQKTFNYFRIYSLVTIWLTVLLFYFSDFNKLAILTVGVAMLLIIRALSFRTLFKEKEEKRTGLYYYNILYLCALEILPVLVLSKVLNFW